MVWAEDFPGIGALIIFPHPGVQTLQGALLALDNCRSFCIYNDGSNTGKRYNRGYLRPSDAVAIVLHIIAETGLPVRSLVADFFAFDESSVEINQLRLTNYQKFEFKNGWSQLQELFFRQRIMPQQSNWVKNLVAAAPNLRCLNIGFWFRNVQFNFRPVGFLGFLGKASQASRTEYFFYKLSQRFPL